MRIPPGLYVQVNKMLRKLDPNSSYMSSRLETHLKRPTKMKVCSFAAVVFISALFIGTANAGNGIVALAGDTGGNYLPSACNALVN
jgi:hypothetical protein